MGPAELAVPTAVIEAGVDSFLVFDAAQQRVSLVTAKPGALQFEASETLGVRPDAACRAGRSVFVLSYSTGLVTKHTIGAAGRIMGDVVAQFGLPLGAPSNILSSIVARGRVFCFPTPDLILLTSNLRPFVRAYSTTGALRWEHRLRGFRNAVINALPGGGVEVRPSSQHGDHFLASAWQLDDTTLAVQFGLMDAEYGRSRTFRAVETRLLHTASGRELGASVTLPVVNVAVGDRLYLIHNDPFPHVEVRRRR